jgi:hypothetical protein
MVMAKKEEGGSVGNGFADFLAKAPTLDEAASDDSVELSGLVSRTTEGRFAISTSEGQTYELDVDAVRDFTPLEGSHPAATIRIGKDVLEKAVIHQLKPIRKDMIKDIIKDIITDPLADIAHGKHLFTDPALDTKQVHKDLWDEGPVKDFTSETARAKDLYKDPIGDTPRNKDIHKDPLSDPVTFVQEQIGTGFADVGGVDPGQGPVINPAVNAAAAAAPFVMATPHQAPQHLLQLQAGIPAQAQTLAATDLHPKRIETLKEPITDTHKEGIYDTLKEVQHDTVKEQIPETHKELIVDTHKELIIDTQKEVWETLVEGGPFTQVEGNQGFPGQGGFPGQPGFLGGV